MLQQVSRNNKRSFSEAFCDNNSDEERQSQVKRLRQATSLCRPSLPHHRASLSSLTSSSRQENETARSCVRFAGRLIKLTEIRFTLNWCFTNWLQMFKSLQSAPPLYLAPFATSRPAFVDMVGTMCTRKAKNFALRLSSVFWPSITYADRINIRLQLAPDPDIARRFKYMDGLGERERWRLSFYMADKLGLDRSHFPSLTVFDKSLISLKGHQMAIEFEMLELLNWRLEEPDLNPLHLLHLLVIISGYDKMTLVPSKRPCSWPHLALRLCLLAAYDPFFSSTNINPTSLCVATFIIAAATAGFHPLPATLMERLPQLLLQMHHIQSSIERLLSFWDYILDLLYSPFGENRLLSCGETAQELNNAKRRYWMGLPWLRKHVLPPGSLHFGKQTSITSSRLISCLLVNS